MTPLKRSSNIAARAADGARAPQDGDLRVARVRRGRGRDRRRRGHEELGDNEGLPAEPGTRQGSSTQLRDPAGETVLIQGQTLMADSPAFRAAVDDVARRTAVRSHQRPEPCTGNPEEVSADGRSAIVFDIRGDPEKAGTRSAL